MAPVMIPLLPGTFRRVRGERKPILLMIRYVPASGRGIS